MIRRNPAPGKVILKKYAMLLKSGVHNLFYDSLLLKTYQFASTDMQRVIKFIGHLIYRSA